MDLSKLPRMSESPAPPASRDPLEERVARPMQVLPSAGAEAWISIAIGVLLLIWMPTTIQYFSSMAFGTTFAPFRDPTLPEPAKCDFIMFTDGTKIFYRDMTQFWSDLAITGFTLVLIFDGLVLLFARNRPLITFAFALTILATAGNLFYLLLTLSQGLAMISSLAVIFGVYIAISQWKLLNAMRRTA